MCFTKLSCNRYISTALSVAVSFLCVYAFATSTTTISSSGISSTGNGSFAELIASATTTLATTTISGYLGIGTTSPYAKLSIENISGMALAASTTLSGATGNEIAYQLNYTTNKATSGNDTGLLINMSDTLSPGTSLLQDWQVAGVSKMSLDNTGKVYADSLNLGKTTVDGINIYSGSGGIRNYGIYANNLGFHIRNKTFGYDYITGGTDTQGLVVNEDSADLDYRVEGNSDAHLIFADAGLDAVGIGYASMTGTTGKFMVNGNVGIGTTSPYSKLSVWGGSADTGTKVFEITSNASTTLFSIDDHGDITGTIVNSSPTAFNMFVGEGAGYSNTTGSQNFFGGYQAGYSNTTGNDNLVMGYQAGYGQDGLSNYRRNVFLGASAGYSNTEGIENFFGGYQAGYSNTTGGANQFIGTGAGYQNVGGNGNVFLGDWAGEMNISGDSNVFLGRYAGEYGMYSSNQVAVGTQALEGFIADNGSISAFADCPNNPGVETRITYTGTEIFGGEQISIVGTTNYNGNWTVTSVVDGSNFCIDAVFGDNDATGNWFRRDQGFNTAVGYGAGQGDWTTGATGSYNSFLGYEAGRNITTGSNNFFGGYQAGYSNTDRSNNSYVGNQAGLYNTGWDNSFFGSLAGYGSSTAATTGRGNSFFGYRAGYANTTGSNAVFVGLDAGLNNTTGNYNTFVGRLAGKMNTTGGKNTFLGQEAGNDNDSGSFNVYLGYGSGMASNADGNTMVGYESGLSNTAGANNFFGGYQAGYSDSLDSYNVFIGRQAGFNNNGDGESGSTNVVIGDQAGYGTNGASAYTNNVFIGAVAGFYQTTGVQNTFVGYGSGYRNTTGVNNTMLGMYSGFENVTGERNVFIGDGAGYYELGSDKLYIANGNQAGGWGIASSTALIYGEFDNQLLRVNGMLEVSSTTATSTFTGNLWVQGTLRAATSYVGDLIFANTFRFYEDPMPIEGQLATGTQSLKLTNQNNEGIFSIDEYGNLTIKGILTQATTTEQSVISLGLSWILDQFKTIGVTIADGIVSAREFIGSSIKATDEFCLGSQCITESQFKELLEKNNIGSAVPPPVVVDPPASTTVTSAESTTASSTDASSTELTAGTTSPESSLPVATEAASSTDSNASVAQPETPTDNVPQSEEVTPAA